MRKLPQEEGRLESLIIAQPSHSFPSPVEEPPYLRLTHEDFRVSGQQCKPKDSTRGQCKLLQKCQTAAPVRAGHDVHRRAKVPLQLWLPEPPCDCTTRHPSLLGASPASLAPRQLDGKQADGFEGKWLKVSSWDRSLLQWDFVWVNQLPSERGWAAPALKKLTKA